MKLVADLPGRVCRARMFDDQRPAHQRRQAFRSHLLDRPCRQHRSVLLLPAALAQHRGEDRRLHEAGQLLALSWARELDSELEPERLTNWRVPVAGCGIRGQDPLSRVRVRDHLGPTFRRFRDAFSVNLAANPR